MSEFGIDLIRDTCNLQPAIDTDQVTLCLACKDTPLQIGDDKANHRAGGHDQLHTIVDLGVDRSLTEIDQLRRTSCKLTTLTDIAI